MARGDVLLITLPTSDGREQSGRRPAVAVQTDVAGEPCGFPKLTVCTAMMQFNWQPH